MSDEKPMGQVIQIDCQRAAESPHFWARKFPHLAGVAISRLRDQRLRFSGVDHGA